MHVYMDKHAYIPVIELYPHQLTSVSSGLFLSNGLLRKNYLLDALIDHLKAHTWELLVQLQAVKLSTTVAVSFHDLSLHRLSLTRNLA